MANCLPLSSAITVHQVSKQFRLYHERNQSLKAAVMRRGRARYEDFLALDDVTLEVPEGSTFGIIGENGSGKSTLLKTIGGILQTTTGMIERRGRLAALLELGAGFHPALTGRENVYLNASILGLSQAQTDQYFGAIVEFSGIERFIDTQVKFYSSGMYVRLAFAIAVHVDPDVLLVDEVLAVGDEPFQRKCRARMDEFHEAGATILLVAHDADLLRKMCTRVAWLQHGMLQAVGKANDVIDLYERASAANELAAPTAEGQRT